MGDVLTLDIWMIYVGTVLALMSTPGPSQLLMLSNSAAHGYRRSVATLSGDLSANLLQMLAAGLGLAAIIAASAHALTIIKWLGVAYLVWLGFRMMLKAGIGNVTTQDARQATPLKTLWLQGFLTSAANPKAVVFFAALFPQFINPEAAFTQQFIILSMTYLVIDGLFLTAYGLGAGWVSKKLTGDGKRWLDRAGGAFMIAAAVLLGLKTITGR